MITHFISLLDKTTGEIIKKNPRVLTKNSVAVVDIVTHQTITIEPFKDSKEIGRFTLRWRGKSVCAGIVNEVKSILFSCLEL